MLNIQEFTVNMIQENCYILSDETNEAVIIDDGAFYEDERNDIENYLEKKGLTPVRLLNTHAHFDHTLGNPAIYDKYGLKADLHVNDAELYDRIDWQVQTILGAGLNYSMPPVGQFLKEGDIIPFGHHEIRVMETPGHTPGGICFYIKAENLLFSGDTLFQQSVGRADLPGGNMAALINSIKNKLLVLPDETQVLTGHGPATTIGNEKRHNLYLR